MGRCLLLAVGAGDHLHGDVGVSALSPTGRVNVLHGDCLVEMATLAPNSIDAIVTDPPYGLGFMGQHWDHGVPGVEFWLQAIRVLKPGGHMAAFSGTRTYHRMAVAIEDAGFEVRDQLAWTYGSGFPKSLDVSKAIDKKLGCERTKVRIAANSVRNPKTAGAGRDGTEGASRPFIESAMACGFHEAVSDEAVSDEAVSWQGWGTALKPAWEPICLARKPLIGTVATNILKYGTGGINIVGTRVGTRTASTGEVVGANQAMAGANYGRVETGETTVGRWPANIIHDGSAEVVALFPDSDGQQGVSNDGQRSRAQVYGTPTDNGKQYPPRGDTGSAARFFYTAKADSDDRIGSKHPTVKPVDLMQWLVRLVTPPGGLVLDPFAGSGTTGEAAFREGMQAVLIEREAQYVGDIQRRIEMMLCGPEERSRAAVKAKIADGRILDDAGPLFGGTEIEAGRQAGRCTATSKTRTLDWPNGAQVVNHER